MSQPITLLKLGGAVITNKEIPNQLRPEVLARLVKEISQAKKENPDLVLIVGNGVGSYAHVPAARYQTMKGFIKSDSAIGMAITQDSAAQINREVVAACLEVGLPAVTFSFSSTLVTNNREADHFAIEVLNEQLCLNLLPVTHGDVIVDKGQGCTIWSTDTIFSFLARKFHESGRTVSKIIHVTEAEGVWQKDNDQWVMNDGKKAIYDRITPTMKAEVERSMNSTKGFDVTGGMWHKIEEALSLADLGITTQIVSGIKPGLVYQALLGNNELGTTIAAN